MDLPTESIQRIADARRQAAAELKRNLPSAGRLEDEDVAPYLPAFTSYACALFDAEAEELLFRFDDSARFKDILANEVSPRIIEDVLPDQGIARIAAGLTSEEKGLSVQNYPEIGVIWEIGPDRSQRRPGALAQGMHAAHGSWESLAPPSVRLLLRWKPGAKLKVREALKQAMERRAIYWVGQFHSRASSEAIPSMPTVAVERKRRGRPQTIPDERKTAASEVRRKGGSNKDAAKVLYDVTYPTPTQVKSTSTILREFQKKMTSPSRSQ